MKGGLGSIHSINRILILSFFVVNIVFMSLIMLFDLKGMHDVIIYIIYADISINIFLIYMYMYFNKKYVSDYDKLVDFFKGYLDDKGNIEIPTGARFNENKKIETLLKRAYIKSNLMKKDMTDFQNMFEKFIPKKIYDKIGYKGHEKIGLGNGVGKKVTVMFLDIMGFTKISESMTPERSLLLLNIYFDGIGDIVYNKGGYIDKFLGDGIMIIFEQDTGDEALMCALEIQEFIKRFQISNIGSKMSIGIGINTGEVVMGTIGTKKRMDVTVIGDNVNIASRLQGLTRKYNKKIILSQNTLDTVIDKEKFSFEKIGEEMLVGKENPVMLYSMDDYYKIDI